VVIRKKKVKTTFDNETKQYSVVSDRTKLIPETVGHRKNNKETTVRKLERRIESDPSNKI
jgi:uncharacterized protein YydD (DUF2326 family)